MEDVILGGSESTVVDDITIISNIGPSYGCSLTHLPRVVSRIEQFWGVQPKVGSHKDGSAKGADGIGIGSGEGAGPPPHKSVEFPA